MSDLSAPAPASRGHRSPSALPPKTPRSARRSPSSLVARVAMGTAIAAAAAALLAAIVSLWVADRVVLDAEDRRLRGTANAVLHDLPANVDDAALIRPIEEEEKDLAPESVRIAVRDLSSTTNANGVGVRAATEPRLIGGDPHIPFIKPGTCHSHEARGSTHRSCAVQRDHLYVAASDARAPRDVGGLLLSCFVAAAIAAVVAAFGGRRAAAWALEPLTRLRDSLDQVARFAVDDPKTATIAGDDTCREVATLRAALGSLVARLAESLDAARRFSADAAHELKTPLTVISGELDLLAEEELDEPTRAAVEKLRSRVGALAKLVERLLALATAAADRSRLTTEAVALEDIARDVIARLGPAARARVTLRADVPGMVLGDELLLAALLENAIDNALKFSGDVGLVDVHVAEDDADDDAQIKKGERPVVVVDVTDDGPGIAPADRARAFEAFFRTPESRARTTGHGVGLALVAQIAAAHSGTASFVDVPARADAETTKKSGARLRVTLPTWSARSEVG